MKKIDSPIFNIIVTFLVMVCLYFAYQWVFEALKNDNYSYIGSSSDRFSVGVSGDKRISGYSGPKANRESADRGVSRPAVTGLPPGADAFAASVVLSSPIESSGISGHSGIVRRNTAYESIQQPMVYAMRTGESRTKSSGAMSGSWGGTAFFGGRRSNTGSQIKPQGALSIAHNNMNQTQPFRSTEEDPLVPRKPDPGTDPTGNPIPIDDGSWILLVMAGIYLMVKLRKGVCQIKIQ
jgi:hypothetical protein